MNSTDRVMTSLCFQEPDHVPLFDSYWTEFAEIWRQKKGLSPREPRGKPGDLESGTDITSYYGVDIYIAPADETPWPTRAIDLAHPGEYIIRRDGWGRIIRELRDGFFSEEIDHPLKSEADLDSLVFEPPTLDLRYATWMRRIEEQRALPHPPCIFAKVGGPYLRTANLRGTEQWLMDTAADPSFAQDLASRVTDHIIQIGLESLRRANLYSTGIWIFDDIAGNDGVLVGPKRYEQIFAPLMARMIKAFKDAGARKVLMHSDGDIRLVLDALIAVGIDGINPVEPKANMDILHLRRKYGNRLAMVGGVCNARVLPRGTHAEIREHVLRALRAAEGGGVVIGAHSIGPDIPLESYEYYISIIREHGHYPLRL